MTESSSSSCWRQAGNHVCRHRPTAHTSRHTVRLPQSVPPACAPVLLATLLAGACGRARCAGQRRRHRAGRCAHGGAGSQAPLGAVCGAGRPAQAVAPVPARPRRHLQRYVRWGLVVVFAVLLLCCLRRMYPETCKPCDMSRVQLSLH